MLTISSEILFFSYCCIDLIARKAIRIWLNISAKGTLISFKDSTNSKVYFNYSSDIDITGASSGFGLILIGWNSYGKVLYDDDQDIEQQVVAFDLSVDELYYSCDANDDGNAVYSQSCDDPDRKLRLKLKSVGSSY
ncbi:MAG: hypothetical protein EZS28_035587 [Streblomastix strix]|uniref:Uncharacterized protein n=1 Tax=Streblomastix strix TaxID=222440 RepID=A0A5J4UH64_9EUKA|nr:MAG: hypothetical protein EZS28_035587 [Streblomastix strix]